MDFAASFCSLVLRAFIQGMGHGDSLCPGRRGPWVWREHAHGRPVSSPLSAEPPSSPSTPPAGRVVFGQLGDHLLGRWEQWERWGRAAAAQL